MLSKFMWDVHADPEIGTYMLSLRLPFYLARQFLACCISLFNCVDKLDSERGHQL